MLGNFKDAKRRMKQKALQSLGAATASDDSEFQNEYDRFQAIAKNIKGLRNAMKAHIDSVKAQTKNATSLALQLATFHKDTAMANAAKEIATVHFEFERIQLGAVEQLYEEHVLNAVDIVLAKIPEIEEKVKQRKKLLLDHDAHLHKFMLAKSQAEAHDPMRPSHQQKSSGSGGIVLKPGAVFRARKKSIGSISEELASRRIKLEHAEMAVDNITEDIMERFNTLFDEFEAGNIIEGPMSAILAGQLHMANNASKRLQKVQDQLPSVKGFSLGLKKWDGDIEKLTVVDIEGYAHVTNMSRISKRVTKLSPRRGSNSSLSSSSSRSRHRASQQQVTGNGMFFGKPLPSGTPPVMCDCIAYIRSEGIWHKGLFRVPGSADTAHSMKKLYDKGKRGAIMDVPGVEIDDVATLLKMYLRELPDSLIPSSSYEAFMNAVRGDNTGYSQRNLDGLLQVLAQLPQYNQMVLAMLFKFLFEVSKYSDQNKMNTVNLATCFAPSILRAPDDIPPNVVLHDMQHAIAATNILIINSAELKGPTEKQIKDNTHVSVASPSIARAREQAAAQRSSVSEDYGTQVTSGPENGTRALQVGGAVREKRPSAVKAPPGLGFRGSKGSSPRGASPRRTAPPPPPGLVNNTGLTEIGISDIDDDL